MLYCSEESLQNYLKESVQGTVDYWDSKKFSCKFFDYKVQDNYVWKFTGDGVTYVMDLHMTKCYAKVTDKLIEIYTVPYTVSMVTKNCVSLGERDTGESFYSTRPLFQHLFRWAEVEVKHGTTPVLGKYLNVYGQGLVTCFEQDIFIDRVNLTVYGDLDENIKEPAITVRKLDMKKVRDARKDYNLAMSSFVGLYQMGAFSSQGWPSYEEWNNTISKYSYEDVVECKPWWWMQLMANHSRVNVRNGRDPATGQIFMYLTEYYWGSEQHKFDDTNPQRFVEAFWRTYKEDVYEKVDANQITIMTVREHLHGKDKPEEDESGDTEDTA